MTIEEQIANAVRAVVREELKALQQPTGEKPLTYSEAAAFVGYHVSTITKWVHDGLLPAHGRGKGKRVFRADVVRALELASKPKAEPTAQEIAEDILSGTRVRRIR